MGLYAMSITRQKKKQGFIIFHRSVLIVVIIVISSTFCLLLLLYHQFFVCCLVQTLMTVLYTWFFCARISKLVVVSIRTLMSMPWKPRSFVWRIEFIYLPSGNVCMPAQANDCFNYKALLDQILLVEGPFYDAIVLFRIMIGDHNWMTDFTNRIHNQPTHDVDNFNNRAGMAQSTRPKAAVWKFCTINQSRCIT